MSWEVIRKMLWKYIKKDCYCWSWKLFNICCKRKYASPLFDNSQIDEMRNIFYKSWTLPSWVFMKSWKIVSEKWCLCDKCNNDAINSHLISKNILSIVFKTTKLQTIFPDDEKKFTFKIRWINEIKTFLWWCWFHDNIIFEEIDNNLYNGSDMHILLYTLRAFWYETRTKQNALRHAYSLFYHNLDNNMLFLSFLWTYQWYIDIKNRYYGLEYYNSINKYNKIKFITFTLRGNYNPIYVSSVFQLQYDLEWKLLNDLNNLEKESVPLAFNIISTDKEVNIIFSCLIRDYKIYNNYFNQLNYYYENFYNIFLNIINNIIYSYSENVILSEKFKVSENFQFLSFYETDFQSLNFSDNPVINYLDEKKD